MTESPVPSAVVANAPRTPWSLPPAELAAYVFVASALFFSFHFHLVAALLAGLLVYTLLHRTARLLRGPRLSHGAAKFLSAGLLGLISTVVVAGLILLLVAFVRGHVGSLPEVFEKMADILDDARNTLQRLGLMPEFLERLGSGDEIRAAVSEWLRTHATELTHAGGEVGRFLVHALMGIVVGVLVFFRLEKPLEKPLPAALAGCIGRFASAFDMIVLAQIEISALNSLFTGVYIFGLVPLLGYRLPFAGTLLAITFLAGLIPVVGNLISNTIIVVISLSVSPWLAALSLGFLVVIHKLEYFLNARIVGSRIGATAWEILVAIIVCEAAFGIAGVVMAPILYAFLKDELLRLPPFGEDKATAAGAPSTSA